eukprot:gene36475-44250_t
MLMEMYGEMADKIALQYGGSEAHRKVITGKGAEGAGGAGAGAGGATAGGGGGSKGGGGKQSELLTSIKRYYSNAFTDMVKQDAMNVFLGCFVPSQSNIPLWDLESDYHLHNPYLRPPPPPIYQVLYEEVGRIGGKVRGVGGEGGAVKGRVDAVVKRVVQRVLKRYVAMQIAANPAPAHGLPPPPPLETPPTPGSATMPVAGEAEDGGDVEVEGIRLSPSDCEALIKKYHIRTNAAAVVAAEGASGGMSGKSSSKKKKNPLNSVIVAVSRLERRRLLRFVISQKVSSSAQGWWRSAIQEFEANHTIRLGQKDQAGGAEEEAEVLPPESYFARFYRPHELTEFDSLLHMDFFAVTDLAPVQRGAGGGGGGGGGGEDATILSSIFYYPGLLTSAVVGVGGGSSKEAGGAVDDENEEIAEAVAQVVQHSHQSRRRNPSAAGSVLDEAELAPESSTQNISTLGRYVRDLGMKARNIVGGFLKKDDGNSANTGNMQRNVSSASTYANKTMYNSNVTHQDIFISKSSLHLYTTYEAIFRDNTLLLEGPYAYLTRHFYDSNAIREEYKGLLRDFIVPVDDVSGMVNLAREACVCSQINKGIFAGLPQSYSARLAYLFLLLSLETMHGDLSSFGDYIDFHYNLHYHNGYSSYAASLLERGHKAHSTVYNSNLDTANLRNMQLPLTSTDSMSPPIIGDYSKRRDMIARNISVQITNKLQERVKESVAKQNDAHFSNYQSFFKNYDRLSIQDESDGFRESLKVTGVAQGLENELRKIINNNIFQQYQYNKDISLDRLALRLSAYCSENHLLNYMHQFDYDVLASDYENLLYILKDSSNFYTSFKEVQTMQRRLEATIKTLQCKKKEMLMPPTADTNSTDTKQKDPAAVKKEKADSQKKRRSSLSYRKQRLNELLEEQDAVMKQASKTRNILCSTGSGRSSVSISSQLGIFNAILEEDLKTDFSLPQQVSESSVYGSAVGYAYSSFPYNEDSLTLADHDYTGFLQLAPDLYARSTNPHLLLNEVGVMKFQEALKRQEMALDQT